MGRANNTEQILNKLVAQGRLPLPFYGAKIIAHGAGVHAKRIVQLNMRYKQRAIAPAESSSVLSSIYHVF